MICRRIYQRKPWKHSDQRWQWCCRFFYSSAPPRPPHPVVVTRAQTTLLHLGSTSPQSPSFPSSTMSFLLGQKLPDVILSHFLLFSFLFIFPVNLLFCNAFAYLACWFSLCLMCACVCGKLEALAFAVCGRLVFVIFSWLSDWFSNWILYDASLVIKRKNGFLEV